MMKYHPEVIAELEKRRNDDPKTCHKPFGAVHFTALKPRPQWCVRPLGHAGIHMPAERYAEYKSLATARQQRKRERDEL